MRLGITSSTFVGGGAGLSHAVRVIGAFMQPSNVFTIQQCNSGFRYVSVLCHQHLSYSGSGLNRVVCVVGAL